MICIRGYKQLCLPAYNERGFDVGLNSMFTASNLHGGRNYLCVFPPRIWNYDSLFWCWTMYRPNSYLSTSRFETVTVLVQQHWHLRTWLCWHLAYNSWIHSKMTILRVPVLPSICVKCSHAATQQWWYCTPTLLELLHCYFVTRLTHEYSNRPPRCYLQMYSKVAFTTYQ